jgi:hypothetical protein
MLNKKPTYTEEFVRILIEASEDAVKEYEAYLLDKIDHNKLAKTMRRLYSVLPSSSDTQKAKKIEDRDHKDFF